jgi:hypothetical protein
VVHHHLAHVGEFCMYRATEQKNHDNEIQSCTKSSSLIVSLVVDKLCASASKVIVET